MSLMLCVSGKTLGGKRPLFPDWRVPVPEEFHDGSRCLRDVIECIVRREIEAFRERQRERCVERVLFVRDIAEGRAKGKIDSGGRSDEVQEVDADEAVAAALQAFEDGIYLVFIDDEEKRDLDETVFLQQESHLLFVRLTLLSGI